jgi:hypothetical protein
MTVLWTDAALGVLRENGSLHDSILEMRDAWSVDDTAELKLHARRIETVEQANAAPQHDGDQADD